MRISDWSSDVCSSDLPPAPSQRLRDGAPARGGGRDRDGDRQPQFPRDRDHHLFEEWRHDGDGRSEEHTSELQSLMRISYAVFCLKKYHTTHMNVYQHAPLALTIHRSL